MGPLLTQKIDITCTKAFAARHDVANDGTLLIALYASPTVGRIWDMARRTRSANQAVAVAV